MVRCEVTKTAFFGAGKNGRRVRAGEEVELTAAAAARLGPDSAFKPIGAKKASTAPVPTADDLRAMSWPQRRKALYALTGRAPKNGAEADDMLKALAAEKPAK